jgi:hypothetical protein
MTVNGTLPDGSTATGDREAVGALHDALGATAQPAAAPAAAAPAAPAAGAQTPADKEEDLEQLFAGVSPEELAEIAREVFCDMLTTGAGIAGRVLDNRVVERELARSAPQFATAFGRFAKLMHLERSVRNPWLIAFAGLGTVTFVTVRRIKEQSPESYGPAQAPDETSTPPAQGEGGSD